MVHDYGWNHGGRLERGKSGLPMGLRFELCFLYRIGGLHLAITPRRRL
jgi:hypothetical protein